MTEDETSNGIEREVKAELTGEQQAQVALFGSAFHEQWRETRRGEDGSFEPRVKATKDEAWITAHGTDQVDIANTSFAELPTDWKAENAAAAEAVVRILAEHPEGVDMKDVDVAVEVGDKIHTAWLARNEYAKGGDLDKPFLDLPSEEQDKDLAQMRTALSLEKKVKSILTLDAWFDPDHKPLQNDVNVAAWNYYFDRHHEDCDDIKDKEELGLLVQVAKERQATEK